MKIAYVAKHHSGGNQEEEAIAWALEQLGHFVERVPERVGYQVAKMRTDLVLFHKWVHIPTLEKVKALKAFWWFDLVEHPSDPTLFNRSALRRGWMSKVMPLVDVGFCTDGDWVDKYPSKLVWLPQGYDTRYRYDFVEEKRFPVLFAGAAGRGSGTVRQSFLEFLQRNLGDGLLHLPKGFHGEGLARLVAQSSVVVAPDGPVTDRYWSNRVYLMLGMGACLLHPYCGYLHEHYEPNKEILYYRSRAEMEVVISVLLSQGGERQRLSEAGRERTFRDHSYVERCKKLVSVVEERCHGKPAGRADPGPGVLEAEAPGGSPGPALPGSLPLPEGPVGADRGEAPLHPGQAGPAR